MEKEEALRIVRTLADGLDPATGETLGEDSVFQQPQTIRALQSAATALEGKASLGRSRSLPARAGEPWLPPEEEQLCFEFERGMSVTEISAAHDRTYGGIIARLEKLGKIPARSTQSAESPHDLPKSTADHGQSWPPEEDERLCLEFYQAVDFEEIASHLGRTKWAIISRLAALGKIKLKAPSNAA